MNQIWNKRARLEQTEISRQGLAMKCDTKNRIDTNASGDKTRHDERVIGEKKRREATPLDTYMGECKSGGSNIKSALNLVKYE
jgi:hypothetical protein